MTINHTANDFYTVLPRLLARRKLTLEQIAASSDTLARRALEEYGAMYVAAPSVRLPPSCIFESERQVVDFQHQAGIAHAEIANVKIELQPAALEKLLHAVAEAAALNLSITPRGGREAARRTYQDSLRLWASRVEPALAYWCAGERLSATEAARIAALSIHKQAHAVLSCEARGLYFSKDFTKSITRSVALPGASQHLAMLAFDVVEFQSVEVRRLLARHGWFQTVVSDLPHFTFLGCQEAELPARGLRNVEVDNQTFWIPNIPAQAGLR